MPGPLARNAAHASRRFVGNEDGATAIEYSLIASLIFMVIVSALVTIGPKLSTIFNTASAKL